MSSNASVSMPLEVADLFLSGVEVSSLGEASPFAVCSGAVSVFVSGAGRGSAGCCRTGEERSTRSSDFLNLLWIFRSSSFLLFELTGEEVSSVTRASGLETPIAAAGLPVGPRDGNR